MGPDKLHFLEVYQSKLTTPEKAVEAVHSGDRVFVGFASNTAYTLMDALWRRRNEVEDVTLLSSNGLKSCKLYNGDEKNSFRICTPFTGVGERAAAAHGRPLEYTSYHLSQVDLWMREIGRPRVAFLMVSPPDREGYMSFGCSGPCVDRYAKELAELVILQINRAVPYVTGQDCLIHVSEADMIVEADEDLGQLPEDTSNDTFQAISEHILAEIPDGATIQLGIGKLSTAIGYGLRTRNDLGIHSELFSEPMMHLMQAGNVTNRQKGFLDGKSVFSFAMGTRALYDFMDRNPAVYGAPFPFVNAPSIIARNNRMISINSAMAIDLLGQVSSESMGWRQFSAVGGQMDFAKGAQMSPGGKSFLAMSSTFLKDGVRHSKIVLQFPVGTVVTTPRSEVQYVATEFGCVNLKRLTNQDRIRAIISLAHPDFRDELTQQAKQSRLID